MNSSLWIPASVLRRQRVTNKDIESRMGIEKIAKHEHEKRKRKRKQEREEDPVNSSLWIPRLSITETKSHK